jgi:hypothetical protein
MTPDNMSRALNQFQDTANSVPAQGTMSPGEVYEVAAQQKKDVAQDFLSHLMPKR